MASGEHDPHQSNKPIIPTSEIEDFFVDHLPQDLFDEEFNEVVHAFGVESRNHMPLAELILRRTKLEARLAHPSIRKLPSASLPLEEDLAATNTTIAELKRELDHPGTS